MEDKESFSYSYSAADQAEIEKIKGKYLIKEETDLDKLKAIDNAVEKKAAGVSIILGVLGTLTMGSGMSLIMTDISVSIGMDIIAAVIIGIIMGFFGMGLVILAYPVYNLVLKKERERVAPEIIKLADRLKKE